MSRPFLPYGRQRIDDDDIAAVVEVLRSDLLTTGPTVGRFEAALAEKLDARFAVVVGSGTAALHLSVLAAGVGPGDCCVVPTVSFVATANVVRLVGAEVLFADVDPQTGMMGPEQLDAALRRSGGRRVKAVLPVHIAGQVQDPEGIWAVAQEHGLTVIEDACHAIGTRYGPGEGVAVGACRHSHAAAFSMHPLKTIAMGEGGAVTTDDPGLRERMVRLRSHGLVRDPAAFVREDRGFAGADPNPWYYEMHEVGFNYRASDLHCALGLSQLAKLDRFVERRRQLVERYDALLGSLSSAVRPVRRVGHCRTAWHLMTVLIDFEALGAARAQVMRDLAERGIGTQVHYIPIHGQPYYRDRYGPLDLPGAEAYYARCLSLPLFIGMSDQDVDLVIEALGSALRVN